MGELPAYHLKRPRLTDRVGRASACVIVGGAGYGKSVLAAESCEEFGTPAISTSLETGGVSAAMLPHRLRSAAARVGLSDLAARMDHAAAAGPAGALDAMLEALCDQGAVFVIDEIQNAEPAAVSLLTRLAGLLGRGQRLLLLGRHVAPELERLRLDGSADWLDTTDLAMSVEEVAALCRDGFGLAVTDADAHRLWSATDGWAAAVVLAASAARSAGRPLLAGGVLSGSAGLLAGLVDQILGGLPGSLVAAVGQAAHLPLLDDPVAEAATGVPGLLGEISRVGLPLQAGDDGWSRLAGPVQDLLTARTSAEPGTLLRAAGAYARRGRPDLAAELLIGAGHTAEAGALLAAMTPQQAERLGLDELAGLVDRLPPAVIARHPRVLVHIARECEPPAALHRRARALEHALELLGEPPADPAVAREVHAELARDLVRDNEQAAGEELAVRVLAQTSPAEQQTQARLLDTLGRAAARTKDAKHLGFAEERLAMAARSYRALGLWSWLSYTLLILGFWVHFDRGAVDQAVSCIDEALAVIPDRRQQRSVILTFRAEVLDSVGRYDEAAASLEEAEAIARVIGDVRVRAYVAWERARALSQQGDAPATLAAIHAAESFRSDWFDGCGGEFLADAADWLDRAGYHDVALQYLDRAQEQSEHEDFEVERARAMMLARSGDPEAAERHLVELSASPLFEPVERWRIQLLRALAAHRRGDPRAAGLATEALELAARLGYPALPFVKERSAAERVLGLVTATGHPLAAALEGMTFPVSVTLLGGFGVTRGGRSVDVPPGQGRQLVKLVATAGGRISAEAATEALWPETDPEVGANRLRTVLNRLRESAGDVVVRDERQLRLAPDATTDMHSFEADARRALVLAGQRSLEAVSAARAALARYHGDLLPDDRYEPWAELPREQLRRNALSLLDVCASYAASTDDLDEAVRCLERAIEIAPDEEERYLTAARHLITQGRRGAARAILDRAAAVIADLGVEAPAALRELEHRVRGRDARVTPV